MSHPLSIALTSDSENEFSINSKRPSSYHKEVGSENSSFGFVVTKYCEQPVK